MEKTKHNGCFYLSLVLVASISFLFVFTGIKEDKEKQPQEPSISSCFEEELPISIGGAIWQRRSDNYSELSLYIKNDTENTVGAIKFFVKCYDVYGEIMYNGIRNCIYQLKSIEKGKTRKATYIIPKDTKLVKIYTYSVYYKNNERKEWGIRSVSREEVEDYLPVTCIDKVY